MSENLIQKNDLLALLPEIDLLSDQELREKCIGALLFAMKSGDWTKDNIAQAPVSLVQVHTKELNNQFDHLKAVVKIAAFMFDSLAETYGKDKNSRDIVIAGALLHDLGKFTEFIPGDGTARYADNAKLIRHPLGGAIMAKNFGLPDKVIHIIAVHSFEGKESYATLESDIVKMADNAAFKYITFFNPKPN